MKLTSESSADMGKMPGRCAVAVPDAKSRARRCGVAGAYTGPDVLAAIEGRVPDRALLTGIYLLDLSLKL